MAVCLLIIIRLIITLGDNVKEKDDFRGRIFQGGIIDWGIKLHKSIDDVWDYLTNQHGHQDLWLREDPIPPGHQISAVLIRYEYMPVIVTGTKRILAYKNLTAGIWVYIGNPLSPLVQEINWQTEPTKIRLDKEAAWQYSLTGY